MKLWKRRSVNALVILALAGVLLASAPALAQADLTPRPEQPIPGLDITKPLRESDSITVPFLAQYVAGVYRFLIAIVGVLAAAMMMVGGFQYLTAGGGADRAKLGREKIANAIIGLLLALGSYVILYTINPDLVTFEGLKIATVKREPLPEFDDKDDLAEQDSAALSIGDARYDEIFKKYAPCAGADWRVLKAIAYKESGLNTNKVNRSNYVGLFQTKPENCASALKGKQLASACNDLTNPEVNTAVGAAMLGKALEVINQRCRGEEFFNKATMLYINHNMGPAVLRHAANKGCDHYNLRRGVIDYYEKSPRGQGTAADYSKKYQPECLASGKSAAECTGGPKFDFAQKTAAAIRSLGVSRLEGPKEGCPL